MVPDAKKAFQKLFVAGTAGAFFAALARNIPVHVRQISSTPNWSYTLDLGVRYLYAFWFLSYFFTSALSIEEYGGTGPTASDILFDCLQSIASLFALFSIGFMAAGLGYPIDDIGSYRWAVLDADVAVVATCLLALILFGREKGSMKPNIQRGIGLIIAVVSGICAGTALQPSFGLLVSLFIIALLLWAPLLWFVKNRLSLALLEISVESVSVTGGATSKGAVRLSGPAPSKVKVSLSGDNGVTVPAHVEVGEGKKTAEFSIQTVSVANLTPATISGVYNRTQTVDLKIGPISLTSLSLSTTSAIPGAATTGTVTLSGDAPAGGGPASHS